jgi:hypothetical protein
MLSRQHHILVNAAAGLNMNQDSRAKEFLPWSVTGCFPKLDRRGQQASANCCEASVHWEFARLSCHCSFCANWQALWLLYSVDKDKAEDLSYQVHCKWKANPSGWVIAGALDHLRMTLGRTRT